MNQLNKSSASGRRTPDHPIDPVFVDRWSPRAFDAAPMPAAHLLTLLEAARWAPSAYNIQPWRFLYVLRDDTHWRRVLAVLDAFNRDWAQQASALIVLLSDSLMPGVDGRAEQPSRTHSLDAGAAWAHLALQATRLGYQAHAMAGVDFDKARRSLGVPGRYRVEIAIAVGRQAYAAVLPQPLREREIPSTRRPLGEIAFPGRFPG